MAGDRTVLSIWGLAIGSWMILLAWSTSPFSVYLGHAELGSVSTAVALLAFASLFFLGWSLMVLAMMLPTTFPLVREFRRMTAPLSIGRRPMMSLVAGCIGIWAPFGMVVYLLDMGVHRVAEIQPIQGSVWILGLSTITLAGAYQFTGMKSRFLNDCCFPSDFLQSRWRDDWNARKAFRIGLGYGRASMGSHWALMLLMFSLGLGSISWMLVLGVAMAVEHGQRLGPKARIPIGVAIMASALYFGMMYARI